MKIGHLYKKIKPNKYHGPDLLFITKIVIEPNRGDDFAIGYDIKMPEREHVEYTDILESNYAEVQKTENV